MGFIFWIPIGATGFGIAPTESRGLFSPEEKVDGSNLGISFDENWVPRLQKRGHWVTPASEAQYAKLGGWLEKHKAILAQRIGELGGHSVPSKIHSRGTAWQNVPPNFLATTERPLRTQFSVPGKERVLDLSAL